MDYYTCESCGNNFTFVFRICPNCKKEETCEELFATFLKNQAIEENNMTPEQQHISAEQEAIEAGKRYAQEQGRIGGLTRSKNLTPERRREISRIGNEEKKKKKLLDNPK